MPERDENTQEDGSGKLGYDPTEPTDVFVELLKTLADQGGVIGQRSRELLYGLRPDLEPSEEPSEEEATVS